MSVSTYMACIFRRNGKFPYYIHNSDTIIQRIYRRRWSVWLRYTGQCHSTAHTVHLPVRLLEEVFSEQLMIRRLWPLYHQIWKRAIIICVRHWEIEWVYVNDPHFCKHWNTVSNEQLSSFEDKVVTCQNITSMCESCLAVGGRFLALPLWYKASWTVRKNGL